MVDYTAAYTKIKTFVDSVNAAFKEALPAGEGLVAYWTSRDLLPYPYVAHLLAGKGNVIKFGFWLKNMAGISDSNGHTAPKFRAFCKEKNDVFSRCGEADIKAAKAGPPQGTDRQSSDLRKDQAIVGKAIVQTFLKVLDMDWDKMCQDAISYGCHEDPNHTSIEDTSNFAGFSSILAFAMDKKSYRQALFEHFVVAKTVDDVFVNSLTRHNRSRSKGIPRLRLTQGDESKELWEAIGTLCLETPLSKAKLQQLLLKLYKAEKDLKVSRAWQLEWQQFSANVYAMSAVHFDCDEPHSGFNVALLNAVVNLVESADTVQATRAASKFKTSFSEVERAAIGKYVIVSISEERPLDQ